MRNQIMTALLISFTSVSMFSQKGQAAVGGEVPQKEKTPVKIASVNPTKTYERIGIKGYKLTAEQLNKVANACYYNGELEKAAKFYNDLYIVAKDFEPEFYYRYAQSLKFIKDFIKADEMMVLFNQKKT